jgi:hypothetical protein
LWVDGDVVGVQEVAGLHASGAELRPEGGERFVVLAPESDASTRALTGIDRYLSIHPRASTVASSEDRRRKTGTPRPIA